MKGCEISYLGSLKFTNLCYKLCLQVNNFLNKVATFYFKNGNVSSLFKL